MGQAGSATLAVKGMGMVTRAEAMRIKDAFSAEHLGRDGVCAVGLGQDEGGAPVLAVQVDASLKNTALNIPDEVGGLPVRVEWTGPFRAQSS